MNGTMKCIYDECSASFNTPMELFDGSFICPKCGKKLNKKISVTVVNSELYGLCSAFFGSYLELSSASLSSEAGKKRSDAECIRERKEQAVRYCREAACLGHPEAMLTLGYYYEIGLVERGSVLERCKTAFYYYNAVAEAEEVPVEDGVDFPVERLAQLRRAAARRILHLLEEYSSELSSRDAQGRYSIKENSDRLRALHLIGANEERDGGMSVTRAPHTDYVRKTLDSCLNKRAVVKPLFGFFTLTRGELIKYYGDKNDLNSLCALLRKSKGIRIMYADSKKHFHALTGSESKQSEKEWGDFKSKTASDPVYLYFYNVSYKTQEAPRQIRRYLKGERMRKSIEAEMGEDVARLINGAETQEKRACDKVFYVDDVFFAFKNDTKLFKTPKSIIDALIKYVGNAEW